MIADDEQLLGTHDPDNEITLTAFRLLTMDLLELYKAMNEGTINVLGRVRPTIRHEGTNCRQNITSKCPGPTQRGR
jgi:ANTH domain